jgi:hypothetical protein
MTKITVGTCSNLCLDARVHAQTYPALVLVKSSKGCRILTRKVLCSQVALVDNLLMSHLGLLLLKLVPQIIVGLIAFDLLLRVQRSLVQVILHLLVFVHDERVHRIGHASFRAEDTSSPYAVMLRMLGV